MTAEAANAMDGKPPILGPVRLAVSFFFPRPKSHYRTGKNAHLLREAAPFRHTSKPDLDKLVRAIGDSLSGVVLRDDSQIAGLKVWKLYDETARVEITIEAY